MINAKETLTGEIYEKNTLNGEVNVGEKIISPPLIDLEINPSKEQQVFNHENSYGYDEVIVNPVSLQDKEITINENGTHNITADEEYDGLNQVSVTVNAIEDLTEELGTYNEELVEQELTIDSIYSALQNKGVIPKKYAPRWIRFEGYSGTELDEELSGLDTSNLTTTRNMFTSCSNLKNIDLSNKNFSNVTNMSYTFNSCSNLLELDFSTLNLEKVTTYQEFCRNASKLTKVTLPKGLNAKINLKQAFENCYALTHIDLSGVTQCSDWYATFRYCRSLSYIDIRNLSSTTSSLDAFSFLDVPAGCEVIVKDDTIKSAILTIRNDFIVKTVKEVG